MARQLKETANATAEAGVAIPERPARTVPAEDVIDTRLSYQKREWKPYTTADELPPAKYGQRARSILLADGTVEKRIETICIAVGEPRYKVTSNELIKVYKKRGGTGTKLIYRFKTFASDAKEAKERNRFNKQFRQYLRSQGIPGA